jgi:hypothetical protein
MVIVVTVKGHMGGNGYHLVVRKKLWIVTVNVRIEPGV